MFRKTFKIRKPDYLIFSRLLTFRLAIVVLLMAPVGAAWSDIVRQESHAFDEEIVVTESVTATRSPYSLDQVANTVRIINRETIERSAVSNIAELLRNYSAVQVRDSMGNGRDARLSLRGYGASANALVLVDGRKLNNSDLGGQDLTAVSVADVERIEILEGGAGALFGDQAVGGVINIITRDRASKGGRASLGRGSYDNEKYALSYSNHLDSGWFYRFNSDLERSDGYRDDSSVNYENYSAKLGYGYSSTFGDGAVFVEARQSDNEYRLTGALLVDQVAEDRQQAGSSFNDYGIDSRAVRFGLDHQFNEALRLLGNYSDRDEEVLIQASSSFGDTVTVQSRRVKTFDPRLILTLEDWRLTLGLDAERVDYDFDIDFGFGSSGSSHENRKRSEYAQLLYSASEHLTFQAGIRHAHLDTDVVVSGASADIDYEQSATVQQLGAVWTGDDWRIYLNRDETFRMPLADENVDFFGAVNLLDVQRGVSWELGGARQWQQVDAKIALFQQDNSDEIGFDPSLGFFGANTNFDDTRRRGTTLDVLWRGKTSSAEAGGAYEKWSAQFLYTYLDARFTEGAYDNKRIPNVARELAKVQVNYQALASLGISAAWVYTGSQTLDLANSAGSLGGYSVANLVGSYKLRDWILKARLNNITAKEYTEFVTFFGSRALYPSPERNLMLSLSYNF
jgi:iron complex outermembrane receptor protein